MAFLMKLFYVIFKVEFGTPGVNSWASTLSGLSLAPTHQMKRHGEGQRKEIYYIA
jgi:hypothetical protein